MIDARALGADCDRCPLRDKTPVPATPATASLRLVVVGEGPGRQEERAGKPFVGPSGNLLNKHLSAIGVRRDECHVTNAALCRAETDADAKTAAKRCASRLRRELAAVLAGAPGAVVATLGDVATRSVLGKQARGITASRGFVFVGSAESMAPSAMVLPTMHPAYYLRGRDYELPIFALDMRRVGRALEAAAVGERLPDESQAPLAVVSDGAAWRLALGALDDRRDWACDIETDGIDIATANPLSLALSDGLRTIVWWPWNDEAPRAIALAPEHAARLAGHARAGGGASGGCHRVVFHNGLAFDVPILRRVGVSFEGVKIEDSLVAHHVLWSHLPKRLDQLVSESCDARPWKIEHGRRGAIEAEHQVARVDKMGGDELARYNAEDALLTALGWQRLLAPALAADPRAAALYANDARMCELATRMHLAGVPVDDERKRHLERACRARSNRRRRFMRAIADMPALRPAATSDVRAALFDKLGAASISRTGRGLPSTDGTTVQALAVLDTPAGRFARALIDWRACEKVWATYLRAVAVDARGRAHPPWKSFGAVSGRFAGRLQSCPRWNPGSPATRVREVYCAHEGRILVYFDVSQAEMRIAAYVSSDPALMAACNGDVHANVAAQVWPDVAARGWLQGDAKKDPARGKPYRDIAKNVGFAIIYEAEAETVWAFLRSKGFEISLLAAQSLLARLHAAFKVRRSFVARETERVRQCGYLDGPLDGRRRWLGFEPSPTDVANYPVQETLAAIMNARTLEVEAARDAGGLDAPLVAQIHDACIYDCAIGDAPALRALLARAWAPPVVLAGGPMVLPIEVKQGARWSDLG